MRPRQTFENRRVRVDRAAVPIIARPTPLKRLQPAPPVRRKVSALRPIPISFVLPRGIKRSPVCRYQTNTRLLAATETQERITAVPDQTAEYGTLQPTPKSAKKLRTTVATKKTKEPSAYLQLQKMTDPAIVKTVGKMTRPVGENRPHNLPTSYGVVRRPKQPVIKLKP